MQKLPVLKQLESFLFAENFVCGQNCFNPSFAEQEFLVPVLELSVSAMSHVDGLVGSKLKSSFGEPR